MTDQETTQATAKNPESPPGSAPSRRRSLAPIFILVVLAAAGFLAWKFVASREKLPGNIVVLSGRIEGDDSAVSPKTSGRILEIRVREGDRVQAGDVIARLEDEQVRAREGQAQASLQQAEARLHGAQQQVAILQDQLQQAQLQVVQAKGDAEGRVHQAEAEVAAAEAELAQQKAALQLAVFDRDAYTKLLQSGAVSERQAKQAVTTAQTQQAVVAATERRLEAAKAGLRMAQATLTNPEIRTSQAAGVRKQIAQQQADIASAQADEERAKAVLTEAQANRQDLIVKAPFDGTIATRTAEPGEVVQAGTALVTILDLSKVYLRGFIPEGQIGKVKTGLPAHVYLDSAPGKPVDAVVSRIDPQATFTPENTYFRDDRVKQVVGVKLQLNGALGYAKPGMPADGEILLYGSWPAGKHHQ